MVSSLEQRCRIPRNEPDLFVFLATPPNAIVFGSGAIRVIDMVSVIYIFPKEIYLCFLKIKAGVVMNLIGFLTIFLAATTWMPRIYNLNAETTELFFNATITTLPTLRGSIKAKG